MSRRQYLITTSLFGIVALALALRFYELPAQPDGILLETAAVVDEVRGIQAGQGPQTVFGFLAAGVLPQTFAPWHRGAVAGGVSIVTVMLVFAATRVWFGNLAGLVAAYFMATSLWQLVVSRSGTPVVLVPFAIALLLLGTSWLLQKATKHWPQAACGGLLAALGAALLSVALLPYRQTGFEPALLLQLGTWQQLPAALTAALSPWPALVAVPLFVGSGALVVYGMKLSRRGFKTARAQAVSVGVLAGLLITWGIYGATVLFVIMPNDSGVAQYYQTDLRQLPTVVSELGLGTQGVFVVADEPTTRLAETLLAGQSWRPVPPSSSHLLVLTEGDVVIFTRSSLDFTGRFEREQLGATLLKSVANRFGQEIQRVYQYGPAVQGSQDTPLAPVHSGLDA